MDGTDGAFGGVTRTKVATMTKKDKTTISAITNGHRGTTQECPRTPQWGRSGYADFYATRWGDNEAVDEWDDEYSLLYQECNPHE